ncbi:MAG: PDZ domain-containing protein [Verrucomicrobiota bacterium]
MPRIPIAAVAMLRRAPNAAWVISAAISRLTNGAYRIAKIIQAAPWDSEVRSPLARPGLTNLSAGDYLLAINGELLDTKLDPWAALQGLADKPVFLTVNDQPTLKGAREILVQTLGSEARLAQSGMDQ